VQAVQGDVEVPLQGVALQLVHLHRSHKELELLSTLQLPRHEEVVQQTPRLQAKQVRVVYAGILEHYL
jgi:hypothetical protein